MKESEASSGTRLKAAVVAAQMGCSLATALKYFQVQAGPDWDEMCMTLQRCLVEGIDPKRTAP